MGIYLTFQNVSFSYDTASSQLLNQLSIDFPVGWTGIVGANGSGKTTLLHLASGELYPSSGTIERSGKVFYCPQRTDFPPDDLRLFLETDDPEAYTIGSYLEVEPDWLDRWSSLSHGERKRAQIAVALWHRPHALAVDEPTNHIDTDAKELLFRALANFSGVGLVVSHDRTLLDSLTRQTLFLEPPQAILRAASYSQAQAEVERETEARRLEREKLERAKKYLQREVNRRREAASHSHQKRSKRGLALKDHDGRFRKNEARLSGKDGKAGQLMNQLQGRLSQVEKQRKAMQIRRDFDLGVCFDSTACRIPQLLHRKAGQIQLSKDRCLQHPDLTIARGNRVALTGPNGSGKSTLLRQLIKDATLPKDRILYLPQEISEKESENTLRQVRQKDRQTLGHMMQIVSRLGSRPARLLESSTPSPGEVRKLLLAMGIASGPWIIIMDEPTNHLDLPSIECLENALKECPCAILLVSHDDKFLSRLTHIRWEITDRACPVLQVL